MRFKFSGSYAGSALKKIGWLIIAMVVALLIGAMIGYSVSGAGNPLTVFAPKTWEHILDFLR
ncbi:MAG TPA: DNA-directed RNA polymerase subunit beta [Lapidilactobacillus dextrinicus]|uniref:DNA-directed RNA polymerase subunit beta n=1 Tax=Lapidilactobacillus dextrinicus TaxID=51664 RepID=A0A921B2V3_9LACO|nr:DNA-directed RNA polymerase subunit beta [Lapidilactobacillus dextrinicus]